MPETRARRPRRAPHHSARRSPTSRFRCRPPATGIRSRVAWRRWT